MGRITKKKIRNINLSKIDEDLKKKTFTIFILFFPSILIALIPETIGSNILLPLALKILLVFYQFIVLKNFVDVHYNG